jgi:alpha-beta hydrolase superfamily lysophospholipase
VTRAAAAACLVAALATSCGGGRPAPPAEVVRFTTEDGVGLVGDLRGEGTVGVVLAHMYPEDRASWEEFASLLAAEGYVALNFDFRGFGGSAGEPRVPEMWRDVVAAAETLRSRGARRVVVVGASMGGTAALVAASRVELDGVVTLSAPSTFMGIAATPEVLRAIDEPKLFIAADGDGQAAITAQDFYVRSPGAKRVEIVTGSDHGTDLLEGAQGEVVRMHIMSFLRKREA